jgi:hypothetical protein
MSKISREEAASTGEKKGGEERRNARNSVWQFGTGNRKCWRHARVYPERENKEVLPLLPLEIWAPCKAVTYSLQFTKASAAALPQEEKINSADSQRGRVNISGFVCKVASKSSRRRTFGEFKSMAVALRRALQH